MIEFQNVGFSYGGTEVLRDLNLTLPAGSFHFLTGPSGSGKTTFLRLCYMELVPTGGTIRFSGQRIGPENRDAIADLRRRVGVVHQDCQFLDHLPLIDNIALPLQVSGLTLSDRASDLEALLDWVGLTGRTDALPRALSGCERQRAALARAVILSPEVILADEPTGSIDREMAVRFLALLVELNHLGKTVLIATHDLDLIRTAKFQAEVRVLRLVQGSVEQTEADP